MAMSTEETDAILIKKAQRSDRAAAALLLMRYERDLTSFIERTLPAFVRPRVSPDDVRQITWEEAYRTIAKFEDRGERSFLAWLSTIARFRIVDAIRAHRAAQSLFPNAEDSSVGLAVPTDPSSSPSRKIARGEGIDRMRQALQSLPHDYRAVLELRYIECLPLDEVARRLGRSPGAVAMLTLRALDQMHEVMGDSAQYFTKKG
jgi:RNA polymerase sigma-70 factor, ECF subfamily